jgi:hypothetical protein
MPLEKEYAMAAGSSITLDPCYFIGKRKGHPATGWPFRLGRIVPTEAKPSELSGEILWLPYRGVKAKSENI